MKRAYTGQKLEQQKRKKAVRRILKRGIFLIFAVGAAALLSVQAYVFGGPRVAAAALRFSADFLQIKELVITGAGEYADRDIRAYIEPIVRVNPNLVTLPSEPIRAFLSSRTYLSRAEIRREMSGRIVIAVTEKKTIACLVHGGFHLIDENGDIVRPMSVGENIDVPVITVDGGVADGKVRELLKIVCCVIQLDGRSLPGLSLSEVRIADNGIVLRSMELKNSDSSIPPLYFSLDGIEKKVLYVKKLWPEIIKKRNEIEYIDGRFRQGIVVKLKTAEVKL